MSAEKPLRISLREALAAKRASVHKCVLDQWVYVPQNEAKLVLNHREDVKYIATYGLATCVGVLVKGSIGVGLAHIDATSVEHAKTLARFAQGTIGQLSKVYIANANASNPMDPTTKAIIDKVKEIFPTAQLINSGELGWDFVGDRMVNKVELPEHPCNVEGDGRWVLSEFMTKGPGRGFAPE